MKKNKLFRSAKLSNLEDEDLDILEKNKIFKIIDLRDPVEIEKAPDNLLKLGITMVQLGEKDQGCKMISGVKKEYPKASKSVLQKAQYEQKKFKCKS